MVVVVVVVIVVLVVVVVVVAAICSQDGRLVSQWWHIRAAASAKISHRVQHGITTSFV